MEHPGFFDRAGPFTLAEVAKAAQAELARPADASLEVFDIKPLSDAGPSDVSFLDNRKYLPQLERTAAGACFVVPVLASRAPASTSPLQTKQPYHAFARALALFYPTAMSPQVADPGRALIDPTAQIEDGAVIEAGAVIGPEAAIGRGARIAAGAVIGRRCMIGRGTYIGANASIAHALIGDRVIIHAGVRIGQDGFGFAMGRDGHLKVPQIGRVIVQDDVEIGANSCVDRGALRDTVIGEGTKIDNLVQIGHNVIIGRHCVIVGNVGIAGSSELGDFVVIGGGAGIVGHVKVGAGAQIAGGAGVTGSLPAGAKVGGFPAVPLREWARAIAHLKRLGQRHGNAAGPDTDEDG